MSDDDAELKRKTDEVLLIAAGLMKFADVHEIAKQLSDLIDSVANDEREACARIAEEHVPPTEAAKTTDWALCIRDANLSNRIAAAIRARGTT